MQISICFLFLPLFCIACHQMVEEKPVSVIQESKTQMIDSLIKTDNAGTTESGFDKAKWNAKDDHHYIYRNEMLTGIMSDHILASLKQDEILDLLGLPDRIDNNYLFYTIAQKRLGFWPLHTKTMVIKLTVEDTVEWIKIHE